MLTNPWAFHVNAFMLKSITPFVVLLCCYYSLYSPIASRFVSLFKEILFSTLSHAHFLILTFSLSHSAESQTDQWSHISTPHSCSSFARACLISGHVSKTVSCLLLLSLSLSPTPLLSVLHTSLSESIFPVFLYFQTTNKSSLPSWHSLSCFCRLCSCSRSSHMLLKDGRLV